MHAARLSLFTINLKFRWWVILSVAQKAGNKGVWPKKQVNKPLLKPATFCCTLCRGQNFKISQNPFAHCLQMVWGRPTQNCRSKRYRLGDHIPIWKWEELGGTYGIWYWRLAAANHNSPYKQTLSVEASHLCSQPHTKFVLSSTKLEVIVKICLFSPRGVKTLFAVKNR